ncbi:peptidoglycan-binding protein [Oceanicella sp. SM1341]|uniref:peptidoglycan-binding domain-containing protein n=1 Tax=Oceanicella sp. SM1341 TaxID=1548889 RepID=UPI000E4A662D|nr:peptidoglycan-binding domain-containing protein [Oceanicella sp. SM1341]
MITRILSSVIGLALCALPAAAQSDRVVALVVSVGEGSARADAIQAQLQVIGAETLRSADPNNAEMRSMLRRFTDEAADSRATLVFIDAPAVLFEGRDYVLPAGTSLSRATDLFTQGVPLMAFARAAAQAEQGGAVLAVVGAAPTGLPEGLSPLLKAPGPMPGSAPVLVAAYGRSDPVVQVISAASRDAVIEVGAMLRRMQGGDGVSVSELPRAPIYLRSPDVPEPEAGVPALPLDSAAPRPGARPETLEELELLEQSLSRAAKRSIQRDLRDLGHYLGLVDGVFGPQTRAAITAFQKERAEEPSGYLTRRQLLDLRREG